MGDEQPVALCLMQIHYSGEPWRGIAASLLIRKLGRCPRTADKIPDNVDFAAQELLEAPADERPAMLENIAKALTRRLLKGEPGIGIREVSERVTAFVKAVRARHLD